MKLYVCSILGLSLLYMCSCTTHTLSQYNNHDVEDQECYLEYGSEIGYCER
jgi:hypothetical protein